MYEDLSWTIPTLPDLVEAGTQLGAALQNLATAVQEWHDLLYQYAAEQSSGNSKARRSADAVTAVNAAVALAYSRLDDGCMCNTDSYLTRKY